MKKSKIFSLILVIVGITCCGVGGVIYFFAPSTAENGESNHNPDTVIVEDDPNYIDRSEEEAAVKKATGNSYYKINTSYRFSTNRKYDSLELTDPFLVQMAPNLYSFSCILRNNSDVNYPGQAIYVKFLDEDGKVIAKLETNFFDIPAHGNTTVSVNSALNILNAYDFEVVPKNT